MEALGVFAVLAALYRLGRCPTFGAADSPRTVYKALFAPGFDPLALLGRIASSLPFDTAWGHVNALSGLFHAGAAALLYAALRRVGVNRAAALAAAALLAVSSRFWYYALVAGRGPAAVFGLALLVWGLLAWNDDDKPRRAAAAALGLALAAGYGSRAASLAPLVLWAAAFGGGLLLQRFASRRASVSQGLLAAALSLAAARPYDLRRHNPTHEYAQALFASAEPGSCLVVSGSTIEQAAKLAAPPGYEIVRAGGADGRPCYRESVLPGGGAPRGLLVEPKEAGEPEIARRAEQALAMSALTSVGARDRAKYGFAGEDILYVRYRAVLARYRGRLGPGRAALRARIDALLPEYRS